MLRIRNEYVKYSTWKRVSDIEQISKMAPTTKRIKRKGHGRQSIMLNNPFHNLLIGRRTGKPLNINARKDSDGFDNIDDYFPDDSEDEENIPPQTDLYSQAKGSSEEARTQEVTSEPTQDACTVLPTPDSESPNNIQEVSVSEGTHNLKTGHKKGNTPVSAEEFPNDLGTAVKNDSVADPTPVIHGTRKRLQFRSDNTPPEPEVKPKVVSKKRSAKKNVSTRSSPDGESDEEIDVTGIDDDDNELVVDSATSVVVVENSGSDGADDDNNDDGNDDRNDDEDDDGENDDNNNAVFKSAEKPNKEMNSSKKSARTAERNKKTIRPKINKDQSKLVKSLSVSVVDVMALSNNNNTFLTIGNATQHSSQAVKEIPPSPASSSSGSFVMDESVMMVGTRHKCMSPEFGLPLKIDNIQSGETKNYKPKARWTGKKNKKQITKRGQPEEEHCKQSSKEGDSEDHGGRKANTRRKEKLVSQTEENEDLLSKSFPAVTRSRKTRQTARVNEVDEGREEQVDAEAAVVTRTTRQATRKTQQTAQQRESEEESEPVHTDDAATVPRKITRQATRQMKSGKSESETSVQQGGAVTRPKRNTRSAKNLNVIAEEDPKKAAKPTTSSITGSEAVENKTDDIRPKMNTRQAIQEEKKLKKNPEAPSPGLDGEISVTLSSPSVKEQDKRQPENADRGKSKRMTRQARSNTRQETQKEPVIEIEEEEPENTELQVLRQTRRSRNDTSTCMEEKVDNNEVDEAVVGNSMKGKKGKKQKNDNEQERNEIPEPEDDGEAQQEEELEAEQQHPRLLEASVKEKKRRQRKIQARKGKAKKSRLERNDEELEGPDVPMTDGRSSGSGHDYEENQSREASSIAEDITGATTKQEDQKETREERRKTNLETEEKSDTVVAEDTLASTSSSSQNEGQRKNDQGNRRRKKAALNFRPASKRNRKQKQSSGKRISKESTNDESAKIEKVTGKDVPEDEMLEVEHISKSASDQSHEEQLAMKANDTGRKRSCSIKTNAKDSHIKSRRVISDIANSYIEKKNQSKSSRKKRGTAELQERSVDFASSVKEVTEVEPGLSETVSRCLSEGNEDLEPGGNGDDLPNDEYLSEARKSPSNPDGNNTPFTSVSGSAAADKKSILKTGQTGRSKSSATRKRKVSSVRKAQIRFSTGGSDADDEAPVNDEPVNKRRSSVSFAPKSTVFGSPSDNDQTPPVERAKHAGGKLSFVSVNSSFPLEDDSYTPSVSHTGYVSSTSSSNVSGSSDSQLDTSLEITKERVTNSVSENQSSTSTAGLRRSHRTRVSPLKFWKNERIDYDTKRKSGFTFKGIIRNPTPTVKKKKKTKTKAKRDKDVEDSGDSMYGPEDLPEGLTEEFNPTATVINPGTQEEVALELFHVPEMLNFLNVSREPATASDPLIIDKYMQHNQFSVGQFVLRAGADKGKQHVRHDTMIFYVLKGKVLVTVHETTSILATGSTFFVPHGNTYQVKNLKKSDATVLFVQVKGYVESPAQ